MVGRQPNTSAVSTPGEIPGTHFQGMSRSQGTWFCRKKPRKNSPVTPPGIDPGTVRLVTQCLNHYTTPGPKYYIILVCICRLSYVACSAHVPYCHLWPVRLYNTFPHCLINCKIFEKKNDIEHQICVLIFSTTLISKHFSF